MGKRERPESEKKAKKRHKDEKVKRESIDSKEGIRAITESSRRQSKPGKSIFLRKKIDIELSLLPGALHHVEDSVHDSIGNLLMQYSDGLGGILMAYEDVRLKSDGRDSGYGWILNELPHIHYTASCDALVFRPHVGCEVSGRDGK